MQARTCLLAPCIVLSMVLCVSRSFAGGGPKNVLLVINDNSPISQSIGAYYQQKRGIPARNVCRIHCSTDELVTKAECEANIVQPIRWFIESSGLHERLDYIVLTKGIPLKASYNDGSWWGPVSVSSVLTCVGEPSITTPVVNPYGPTASPSAPVQYFTHQLSFNGRSYYAVTRLDAYTEEQVHRMIDDVFAAEPNDGLFLMDGRYEFQTWSQYYIANDRLRSANSDLYAAGYQTYYDPTAFDSLITQFVGGQSHVMGYFSWGSNESSYSLGAYTSNLFVPGSIADGYTSTNGRTFTYPPVYGQSLIADLIPQGLSGGNGYVSEPGISLSTYPNVLFNRYVRGYNMAESFLAASPRLYWKAVTVGDPLMAPYATPPDVGIISPDDSAVVRGSVLVSASAYDASGIGKVEFYVDDYLVAVSASPPYQFVWDTTAYVDGTHIIEAIAYENTPVFTQNTAGIQVEVANAAVEVEKTGALKELPDGTVVYLASKPAIAGTDVFTDCLYLSEPDRSAGVRVEGESQVPTGSMITVVGRLATRDGERVILADYIASAPGTELPSPLGMPNLFLGNGSQNPGLRPGLGNTGLLVSTWGRVTQSSPESFLISDGTVSGEAGGVVVSLENLAESIPSPSEGTYVNVTGVSSYAAQADGSLRPAIRPRSAADISFDIPIRQLTLPEGAMRPGWNLISISAIPADPRAEHLFEGLPIDGRLFYWDALTQSLLVFDMYSPELFPAINPCLGFWFMCEQMHPLTIEVLDREIQVDMWISLPSTGFTLLGYPFNNPVNILECLVSDGMEVLPIRQAVYAGWVSPAFYCYDNLTRSLNMLDVEYDESSYLEPWKGYWFKSRRPNLALIIPH